MNLIDVDVDDVDYACDVDEIDVDYACDVDEIDVDDVCDVDEVDVVGDVKDVGVCRRCYVKRKVEFG